MTETSIDRVFHALGDPTRRAIIHMLSARPHSVSTLAGPLNITLTAVVQHLQILEDAALVITQKLGRVRTCAINPEGFAALERWLNDRKTVWEHRLDRLGEILNE